MNKDNKNKKIFIIKSKAGFAVLFAVLLASFLITLGLSIFSVSLKEIMIVTSVRDSQIAYYAADSARECALYWDVKVGAFPACLNSSCSEVSTTTAPTVSCNGNSPITLKFQKSANEPIFTTVFNGGSVYNNFFDYSTSTGGILPVADLRITKQFDGDIIKTTIETWGHNTTVIGRRVERGISQKYNL